MIPSWMNLYVMSSISRGFSGQVIHSFSPSKDEDHSIRSGCAISGGGYSNIEKIISRKKMLQKHKNGVQNMHLYRLNNAFEFAFDLNLLIV